VRFEIGLQISELAQHSAIAMDSSNHSASGIGLSAARDPLVATTYLTVGQAQKLALPKEGISLRPTLKITAAQMKAIEKGSVSREARHAESRASECGDKSRLVIQDEVLGKHDFIQWVLDFKRGCACGRSKIRIPGKPTVTKSDEKWRAQLPANRHGASSKSMTTQKHQRRDPSPCRHITGRRQKLPVS